MRRRVQGRWAACRLRHERFSDELAGRPSAMVDAAGDAAGLGLRSFPRVITHALQRAPGAGADRCPGATLRRGSAAVRDPRLPAPVGRHRTAQPGGGMGQPPAGYQLTLNVVDEHGIGCRRRVRIHRLAARPHHPGGLDYARWRTGLSTSLRTCRLKISAVFILPGASCSPNRLRPTLRLRLIATSSTRVRPRETPTCLVGWKDDAPVCKRVH